MSNPTTKIININGRGVGLAIMALEGLAHIQMAHYEAVSKDWPIKSKMEFLSDHSDFLGCLDALRALGEFGNNLPPGHVVKVVVTSEDPECQQEPIPGGGERFAHDDPDYCGCGECNPTCPCDDCGGSNDSEKDEIDEETVRKIIEAMRNVDKAK